MFITKIKALQERGDTIVEVLISIAVISTVMAGAFVTTNHSLQATRQAQERVNGLKLVESQIELIKAVASTNSNALFGAGAPVSYCITSASAVVASTNTACAVDTTGAASSKEPVFHLSITRTNNTFTIRNTWSNVRGAQDNVEMKYRMYQ
jgi:type II secretory pathway pseudopilin PulG